MSSSGATSQFLRHSCKAAATAACCALLLAGCEDGGKSFRRALRGAATNVDRPRAKLKNTDTKKADKPIAGKSAKDNAAPAPKNENAIQSCPQGARLNGAPPPQGSSQWCAKKNDEGKAVRHGEFRRWHKNGELKESGFYLNDEPHGIFVKLAPDGQVLEEKQFYEGRLHGAHIKYDKSGTRRMFTTYHTGKKHGKWMKWTRHGIPRARGTYYLDERHERWYSFHRDGQVRSLTTYYNGKKNGPAEEYSRDGILIERGEYTEDEPDNRWTTFYRDGSVKTDGTYVDGKKHGTWISYTKGGQIRKQVVYENGNSLQEHSPSRARRSRRSRGKPFGSRDILGAEPPRTFRPRTPAPPARQEPQDTGWTSM